ncbi:Alpha/Beta hydrolase protein [Mycena latifolia]|nr:Alpha/Beta hydrolase protein [Mycena latifolia]
MGLLNRAKASGINKEAGGSTAQISDGFDPVWCPVGASAGERLPILVDIFGGGYFSGSDSEWDGTSLVRRSIATKNPFIFINFNYRTGVFGFIGSAQAPPSALNVGLQDHRDALRWIQDNAAAFARGRQCPPALSLPRLRAGISRWDIELWDCAGNLHPACEWHDRPSGAYNILGNITGCGIGAGSFECLQNIPFDVSRTAAIYRDGRANSTVVDVFATGLKHLPGSRWWFAALGSFQREFVGPSSSMLSSFRFLNFLSILGTSFLDLTPPPPLHVENSLLSAFIAKHATNFKNASQDTINSRRPPIDLYAQPTDSLSNSSLYNRAAQLETDYPWLAPQRLFLKAAAGKQDFSPVPTLPLVWQLQDIYISFTNDLNPGTFRPKYTEESKIARRLLDGAVGPIVDSVGKYSWKDSRQHVGLVGYEGTIDTRMNGDEEVQTRCGCGDGWDETAGKQQERSKKGEEGKKPFQGREGTYADRPTAWSSPRAGRGRSSTTPRRATSRSIATYEMRVVSAGYTLDEVKDGHLKEAPGRVPGESPCRLQRRELNECRQEGSAPLQHLDDVHLRAAGSHTRARDAGTGAHGHDGLGAARSGTRAGAAETQRVRPASARSASLERINVASAIAARGAGGLHAARVDRGRDGRRGR